MFSKMELGVFICCLLKANKEMDTIGILWRLIDIGKIAGVDISKYDTRNKGYRNAQFLTQEILPELTRDEVLGCDKSGKRNRYWLAEDWVTKFDSWVSKIQYAHRTRLSKR